MKYLRCKTVTLLAGLLGASAAVAGTCYFREDFRNYRDVAPICVVDTGLSVGNDPIWANAAELNCRRTVDGPIFHSFLPESWQGHSVTNYEIRFRFKLLAAGGRFQLVLRSGLPAGGTGDLRLDFASATLSVTSAGLPASVTASAGFPASLADSKWHRGSVTVQDGALRVAVDTNRLFAVVLSGVAVPPLPLAGINFSSYANAPFSLTDLVIQDPGEPLPDNRITAIMPVSVPVAPGEFQSGGSGALALADRCGAALRVGAGTRTASLALGWSGRSTDTLYFSTRDATDNGITFPDAVIRVENVPNKGTLDIYIRPLMRRYRTSYSVTDTYNDIVRDRDLLPRASEHPLQIELRRTGFGANLLFDGCHVASITGTIQSASYTLNAAASIGRFFAESVSYDTTRYLPLEIGALRMARSFAGATNSLPAGFNVVSNVPFYVAGGQQSGDVGLAREGQGNWALEVDEYLARSPFDGLLTELHFTVPGGAPYMRAWVLCAVDPDPAKTPLLTTRLAHYIENGTGNNQLVDTYSLLPRVVRDAPEVKGPWQGTLLMVDGGGGVDTRGIREVGSVQTYDPASGRAVHVPLYLVEVPIDSGEIIDLAMDKPALNFEFFGKPSINLEQLDNTSKPDPQSTSAVQIFGVTLERAPVGFHLVQSQPGNVFHNDEVPQTTLRLRSFGAASGNAAWRITDLQGAEVGRGSAPYQFAAAGETATLVIPLAQPRLGWYGLTVSLTAAAGGRPYLVHRGSFALLAPDTRQASHDSPFGTWWFDGAHNTPSDLAFGGPILFKAGIRQVGWTGKTGASLAAWSLYKDQLNMPFSFGQFASAAELAQEAASPGAKTATLYAAARTTINAALANHPHLREILVYHESGPDNTVPLELIGVAPALDPATVTSQKRYADLLNFTGRFFRESYPQLRLVVGNSSSSAACIAAILRHGGNPDYIDRIGVESASQVYIPEKLQEWALQGIQIARDTAKTLSGRDIPGTGCYEFTYRCERDMGEEQQAQWYVRDTLIGLANAFTHIGPGILFDCSTVYYNTLWGGSGLLRRGPFGYPKPSYVGYAVATRVMDRVVFRRQIPTGSGTFYAVAFDRADGRRVTALWASRGEADVAVDFEADGTVTEIEMFGNSTVRATVGRRLTATAGTSPLYLVADHPVASVGVTARRFPRDARRGAASRVIAPLQDAAALAVVADTSLETPKAHPLQTPIRQLGTFALRSVTDAEQGACIEVELLTNSLPVPSKYITEYTTLKLAGPAPAGGRPAGVGIWVRGNSSWGRVMFELQDAGGEVWRSVGTGGWGCDILDWPGNLALNFDGWSYVALPLRDTPLFNDHSPGPVLEQWVSGGGNKRIDYPIRLTGLIVELNRTALNLRDFESVPTTIRLKDLSVFY